jgi:hypothetical protein
LFWDGKKAISPLKFIANLNGMRANTPLAPLKRGTCFGTGKSNCSPLIFHSPLERGRAGLCGGRGVFLRPAIFVMHAGKHTPSPSQEGNLFWDGKKSYFTLMFMANLNDKWANTPLTPLKRGTCFRKTLVLVVTKNYLSFFNTIFPFP